jgi:hypothetical protein
MLAPIIAIPEFLSASSLVTVNVGRDCQRLFVGAQIAPSFHRCLIPDKDRAALDLQYWILHQRRTRCGFSKDCDDEAEASARSNANFSRLSSPIFC